MSDHTEPTVLNDRYQLEQRIGRGGMADVFLARDLLLDRPVAIKVLFPEFAVDPNLSRNAQRASVRGCCRLIPQTLASSGAAYWRAVAASR